MANWCYNLVTFQGNVADLTKAVKAAIAREEETWDEQMFGDLEAVDGCFFETQIANENDTKLSIVFETEWKPNLGSIAAVCKAFGVEAEARYEQLGDQIYGKATFKADGTFAREDVPQAIWDRIEYSNEYGCYLDTVTGEESDDQIEIIESIYRFTIE